MGSGGGLEGDGIHAGDLTEQVLCPVQDGLSALDGVGGLEGVQTGKAGQGGGLLPQLGVVLHGTGAQWVEAVAHAEGPAGEGLIVAGQVALPQLRQAGDRFPPVLLRQGGGGHVQRRQKIVPPARAAALKNQLHLSSTSLTMDTASSSSARLCFSVAHHSSPPSTGQPPRMPRASRAESTFWGSGRSVTNSWKKGPG